MTTDPDELLAKIVGWANADANVLALIMTGSRARLGATPDEFSDHDLEIIAAHPEELARDDAWLHRFARVLVCLPLSEGQPYPTRLVFCHAERAKHLAANMITVSTAATPRSRAQTRSFASLRTTGWA